MGYREDEMYRRSREADIARNLAARAQINAGLRHVEYLRQKGILKRPQTFRSTEDSSPLPPLERPADGSIPVDDMKGHTRLLSSQNVLPIQIGISIHERIQGVFFSRNKYGDDGFIVNGINVTKEAYEDYQRRAQSPSSGPKSAWTEITRDLLDKNKQT